MQAASRGDMGREIEKQAFEPLNVLMYSYVVF